VSAVLVFDMFVIAMIWQAIAFLAVKNHVVFRSQHTSNFTAMFPHQ
jgi:hypothetical protein